MSGGWYVNLSNHPACVSEVVDSTGTVVVDYDSDDRIVGVEVADQDAIKKAVTCYDLVELWFTDPIRLCRMPTVDPMISIFTYQGMVCGLRILKGGRNPLERP